MWGSLTRLVRLQGSYLGLRAQALRPFPLTRLLALAYAAQPVVSKLIVESALSLKK